MTHKLETALLVFAVSLSLSYQFGWLKKEYDLLNPANVHSYQIKLGDGVEGDLVHANNQITFTCHRIKSNVNIVCGAFIDITGSPDKGVDFSTYDQLEIEGSTDYPSDDNRVRISLKNYHPNYSYRDEDMTHKVNAFLSQKLEGHGQLIPLDLLRVQQWWLNMFRIPLEDSLPDISDVVNIDIRVLHKGPIGEYKTTITKLKVHGNYLDLTELFIIVLICSLVVASLLFREAAMNKTMASTDILTGLMNRHGMQYWLRRFQPSKNKPIHSYLFFIDVDDFKTVNDTHGHQTGDALLVTISKQVLACLHQLNIPSQSWSFVRLSGDEFLIIFTNINNAQAHLIADKIIATTCQTFRIEGADIANKISLGVASGRIESTNIKGLLEKADSAMYAAKKNGKCQYKFFDVPLSLSSITKKQNTNELYDAATIRDGSLRFSPIFDAQSSAIKDVEVTLHSLHSAQETFSADNLLNVFEASDHSASEAKCLLSQTCMFLNKHRGVITQYNTALQRNIRFHIKTSKSCFSDNDFFSYIIAKLKEYDIPTRWIGLVIAEASLHNICTEKLDRLNKLAQSGIELCLDHFGSKNTLLYQLADYPINKVKIYKPDGREPHTSEEKQHKITDLLFCVALHYQLEVIAAEVDTQHTFQFFAGKAYQSLQGALLSPCLTEDELVDKFKTGQVTEL